MTVLGVIAGSRSLPLELVKEAKAQGVEKVVVACFEGETDPSVAELGDVVGWMKVGQLGRLIRFFKENHVERCVMAGQIAPSNLFHLRPDGRALRFLLSLRERHAHSIFGGIARELEKDGILLIEGTPWLRGLLPGGDFHYGRPLSESQKRDLHLGLRTAREIARLEIGQLVIVKEGTVLAVEGFEGTDACLRRGGELAGKKGEAVAVKVAKQNHDMRFDIPCIGPRTIKTCADSGVRVLAFEGGRTFLIDRDECLLIAKKAGVVMTSIPADDSVGGPAR